jgi:6-pyruvoyltetrahydropterin/6-carboxytetrahydropterin synthase
MLTFQRHIISQLESGLFQINEACKPSGRAPKEARGRRNLNLLLDMKTSITRVYRFEAAHFLPLVPEGHRCRRMHGHNYAVEITCEGTIGEDGFILDFAKLDQLVGPMLVEVDHRLLNEIEGLSNPTAEIIAQWFASRLPISSTIKVYENADSWATVIK